MQNKPRFSARRLAAPFILTAGLLPACGGAPTPPPEMHGNPPQPQGGHENPPGVEPTHANPPPPEAPAPPRPLPRSPSSPAHPFTQSTWRSSATTSTRSLWFFITRSMFL